MISQQVVQSLLIAVFILGQATLVSAQEQGLEPLLPVLVDVTAELGVGDTAHHHFGICAVDINQDGWIDLYYPNGHRDPIRDEERPQSGTCYEGELTLPQYKNENTCYINNGDGTFSEDVAADWGINDAWNAMRSVWGDYDNDGYRDLLTHNFVSSPFYHRIPGSDPPLFEEVGESSGMVICLRNGTSASWIDLNNDGWLDLYACEWFDDRVPEQMVDKMYLNNGDGTFSDITVEAGVWAPGSPDNDNPMGSAFYDYDNDGDQDFYVANSPPAPTRLWRNEGVDEHGIPHFVNVAAEAGVEIPGEGTHLGFSVNWGDFNNDGYADLWFGRGADSHVFRSNGPNNEGLVTFTDVSNSSGMAITGHNLTDAGFVDLNNDGWQDLICVNGRGIDDPNLVYINNGDPDEQGNITWSEHSNTLGLAMPQFSQKGVVGFDYDNNGTLDLLIWNRRDGDPNMVIRNDGVGHNWIQFRLTGTLSNRDAVGARIEVEAALPDGSGTLSQIRSVVAGTGFFSDRPRIQHFGLGTASDIVQVVIRWPSGIVQELGNLDVNKRHDVEEPDGSTGLGDAGDAGLADRLHLWQNYPNPFNPQTQIRYQLAAAGPVKLSVYNVVGEEVLRLVDSHQAAGDYELTWDGRDQSGHKLVSGTYFLRLQMAGHWQVKKMLLVQ